MNGPLVSLCIAKISVCSFFFVPLLSYIHSFFIYCNFSFGRCFFHRDRKVFLFLFLVITSPCLWRFCTCVFDCTRGRSMCVSVDDLHVFLSFFFFLFFFFFIFFFLFMVNSLAPLNFNSQERINGRNATKKE